MRAALIAEGAALPSRAERLRAWAAAEAAAQTLRWRLWAPVAFGGGCACYFAFKKEPPLWPLLLAAVLALAGWQAARRLDWPRLATLPLMLLACGALGLCVAKLRSDAVAAPIAPSLSEPTVVEGWVIDVDSPGESGHRIILAPVRVRGLAPEATPMRLRATVRGEPPRPGEPVRLFGLLNPPPAPAAPGAYDFGRVAWFQGLGGVLFGLGETRGADLAPPPWRVRVQMRVNATRFALSERIVERLGPRTGGIAAAMVTGHETWLGREDLDAMRDAGLAHILSISGLHMVIVGGFTFFLIRLLIAAWPWLALRISGKKVAAWAGLLACWTYLIVSGAPPPAERAAITASIAFIAVLLDRQAITMHALAVAAFAVLLLQPEAVVTPGFQMSFAATAALVALAEIWPTRTREINAPWAIKAVQRSGAWVFAAVAASFVAGVATGPFAIQHFNRMAVFGLAANLLTAPISSFLMMPALAVGAALEPLGLGGPFLWLSGLGVDLMLAIGHWTAGLPNAVRTIPSAPTAALPIAFLGLLFVCLWRGRLRWLGAPLALAVLLWPRAAPPDVWIGDGGANAAYRAGAQAVVLRPGVGQFGVDVWSRRRGLEAVPGASDDWTCSRFACWSASAPMALWWGRRSPTSEQLSALCQASPVVSVRAHVSVLPPACEGRLVLDAVDYAETGAVELWRTPGGWRAVTASEVRGDRPWSP